jgi:anti-sigma factor RsiW
MNCNTLHTRIIFFTEGSLPQNEMEEIRSHLEKCPDCAAFAEEMKKTLIILQNDKLQEVNPFFYTRVKARLENQAAEKVAVQQSPVFVRILQSAFFSLLLVAGIYTGIKIGQPEKIHTNSSVYTEDEMIPYLNEMETETIENFLME